MTEEDKQILIAAGMDFSSALERFMNSEAMLEKFLLKFRKDPSYASLKAAVAAENLEEAFRAAHTLKGVAANFSFTDLQAAASAQTEEFRAGKLAEGIAMMPAVEKEYARIDEALTELYGPEE